MNRVSLAVSNFFFFLVFFTSLYGMMEGSAWILTLIALIFFVSSFLVHQMNDHYLTEETEVECIKFQISMGFLVSFGINAVCSQWYSEGYRRLDITFICATVNSTACFICMLYFLCLPRSQDHKLHGKRGHYFLLSCFFYAPYFCFIYVSVNGDPGKYSIISLVLFNVSYIAHHFHSYVTIELDSRYRHYFVFSGLLTSTVLSGCAVRTYDANSVCFVVAIFNVVIYSLYFVYIYSTWTRSSYVVHTNVTQEACASGLWSSRFTNAIVPTVSASVQHENTWAIDGWSSDTSNPIGSQTQTLSLNTLSATDLNVKQDSTRRPPSITDNKDLFSVSSGAQALSREPPAYSDEMSVWVTSSQGNVIYASDVEPLLEKAVNLGRHEATLQEHLVTGTLTSGIDVGTMVTRL